MTDDIFVSVIVPVYQNQEALAYCLESLNNQTYSQESFEIIVVNNYPQEEISQDFGIKNLRLIKEYKTGSYAARNTGINFSRGNILGFCDADCLPRPDWIEKAVCFLFTKSDCYRLAGRVELFFASQDHLNYAERYEKIFAFRQKEYARQGTSATANMFTYRYLFDQVGLFNENLFSGGDLEWGKRAQKAGFRIEYSPEVLVFHPARKSVRELIHKSKRVCSGYIEVNNARITNHPIRAVYHGLSMLKPPLKAGQMIFAHHDMKIREKVIVYLLEYLLKLIQFWEFSSLQFGKKAMR